MKLTTIVSGGQTGCDQGALDAAIELDLSYGGWAPAGWRAEDGEIPEVYRSRMRCTSSANYGMRTRLNIQDSDGTLIVSFAEDPGGGTAYTIEQCVKQDKAHIHVVLPCGGRTAMPDAVAAGIREWIDKAEITVLNVAGPRESKEPGIQEAVRDLLVWVLEDEIERSLPPPTRDEVWQGVFGDPSAPVEKLSGVTLASGPQPPPDFEALAIEIAKTGQRAWPSAAHDLSGITSSPAAAGASDAGPSSSGSPDVVGPAAAQVAPVLEIIGDDGEIVQRVAAEELR